MNEHTAFLGDCLLNNSAHVGQRIGCLCVYWWSSVLYVCDGSVWKRCRRHCRRRRTVLDDMSGMLSEQKRSDSGRVCGCDRGGGGRSMIACATAQHTVRAMVVIVHRRTIWTEGPGDTPSGRHGVAGIMHRSSLCFAFGVAAQSASERHPRLR